MVAFVIGSGYSIGSGWSISPPLSLITNGLLFNVDMQNYTSGTTWLDNSGNNNNFTFSATPTVTNLGTTTAYFTAGSVFATATGGTIFGAVANYSKGIVIRGNGSSFGTGNLISSTGNEAWYFNGSNVLYGGNNNGDGVASTVQTSGSEAFNVWYYLSMTFITGTGWQFYVNGSPVTTSSGSTVGKVASTPQIGAFASGYNFTGSIAVAHVYTRALSAAEHLSNYNYYNTRYSGSTPA